MKLMKRLCISIIALSLLSFDLCYSETSVEEMHKKAVEHASLGKFNEAKAALEKVLEIDPFYGSQNTLLGYYFGIQENLERYLRIIEGVIKQKLDADMAVIYFKGIYYQIERDRSLAIDEFNKVIDTNPDFADAYYSRGRSTWSISDFNKALEIDPGFKFAYLNRAFAHSLRDRYDEAISDCNKAIEIDKKFSEAYILRGKFTLYNFSIYKFIFFSKLNIKKIISDLSKAIELNPDNPKHYSVRAEFLKLFAFDDYTNEIISDYSKAITLNPKETFYYTGRADVYGKTGRLDEAVADYTKIIEFEPESSGVYNSRGDAYTEIGRFDKAIADHSKAIELYPEYGNYYYSRGNTYTRAKQYDKAIADYNKAIEFRSRSTLNLALAYSMRGDAYEKIGNLEKACSDWKKICRPGNCKRWSIVNRIRCLGK